MIRRFGSSVRDLPAFPVSGDRRWYKYGDASLWIENPVSKSMHANIAPGGADRCHRSPFRCRLVAAAHRRRSTL